MLKKSGMVFVELIGYLCACDLTKIIINNSTKGGHKWLKKKLSPGKRRLILVL
jgi:hypothetical protein